MNSVVRDLNPSFESFIYDREGHGQKWQRIRCIWKEKNLPLEHRVALTINKETTEIYLDCRKRKIWAKCVVLTVLRPLHTIILRTAYHILLPISLPLEIAAGLLESKLKKLTTSETINVLRVRVFHSLQDIFRSPFYGVILTTISLAGVVLGPLAPQKLYDIRAFYGKVERTLNREKRFNQWTLAPCFSPFSNLKKVRTDKRCHDDTSYEDETYPKGLAHLARTSVRDLRIRACNPFNYYLRLDPNKAYTSAAWLEENEPNSTERD